MITLPNDAFKTIKPTESGQGYKWYNFLVYFGIWFGAASNLILGVLYLCSCPYLGSSTDVYTQFSALKNVDFLYGIYRVIFGVFLLFTGWSMLKRKFEAPILLYGASLASMLSGYSYAFAAASNVVSSLVVVEREGIFEIFTSPFSSFPIRPTIGAEFLLSAYGFVIIAISAVALIFNMIYFNKRELWFERKKAVKAKKK